MMYAAVCDGDATNYFTEIGWNKKSSREQERVWYGVLNIFRTGQMAMPLLLLLLLLQRVLHIFLKIFF